MAGPVFCETRSQEASRLVKVFAKPSAAQQAILANMGIFECGSEEQWASATAEDRLVDIGLPALSELDRALKSIQDRATASPYYRNARHVLNAYARIRGPVAAGRFGGMLLDPRFSDLCSLLDDASALALNLTSFASGCERPARVFSCFTRVNDRDALYQFIAAWQRDDQNLLEKSLGPSARSALVELLGPKDWATLRNELGARASTEDLSMGYRRLRGARTHPPGEFEVIFKDRFGGDCSPAEIIEAYPIRGENGLTYKLNNENIEHLLRLVSSCSARKAPPPVEAVMKPASNRNQR